MSFKLDIDKWVAQANSNSDKVARGAILQVFGEIVKLTPVGNSSLWKTPYKPKNYVGGRLRNSWNTSIGAPANGSTERQPNANGSESIADLSASMAQFKAGDVAYLLNNLPYALRVEEGHSTQKPNGWVKNTVKSFNRLIEKEARKVKK